MTSAAASSAGKWPTPGRRTTSALGNVAVYALGVTIHALGNHLVRIFARVGASNRADPVRLAVLSRG